MKNNLKVIAPYFPRWKMEIDKEGFGASQGIPDDIDIDPKRISDAVAKLSAVTENLEDEKEAKYIIDEIEFNLIIDFKGKVGLLGSGIEGGISHGIKVKMKRNA